MNSVQKYKIDNIIVVIPAYNPSDVLLELITGLQEVGRSEERRVGKECL